MFSPFNVDVAAVESSGQRSVIGGVGLRMKDWAEQFYNSPVWKNCRAAYIKQAGGLCERCMHRGLVVPGEIVHHKIHLTPENIGDPNISCSFDNLELVCRDCHAEEHSRLRKRYRFDETGRVIPPVKEILRET